MRQIVYGYQKVGPAIPGVGPVRECKFLNSTIVVIRDNENGVPIPYMLQNKQWLKINPEAMHV